MATPAVSLVALAVVALAARVLSRTESWLQGYLGESRALSALRDLPGPYVAVTNFVVPDTKRGDVDLLLVGPMGVVVAEIKTYPGTIVYDGRRWWRKHRSNWRTRLPKDPSAQARGRKGDIQRYIKAQREQRRFLSDVFVPVSAVLVFVGTDHLDIEGLDIPALKLSELSAHVRRLPPRLNAAQVEEVAALFERPRRAA